MTARIKRTPEDNGVNVAKRAVITGISGQDGSYLAELLLEKGYEVTGIVRRSSAPNLWRIEHLLDRITLRPADLPQAYESAWLACRLIAEHEGQDKLVAFYRAVDRSGSAAGLADAFKSVLGMTDSEFVVQWQKYLKRLAGA